VEAAALVEGVPPVGDEVDDALHDELRALNERIIQAEVAWLEGPAALEAKLLVSVEGYRRWRSEALARRDELQRRLAKSTRARTVLRAAADPHGFWEAASLQERRDAVRVLLPEITVQPAQRGSRRRWNSHRIESPPAA
jgi:hypothetical protein